MDTSELDDLVLHVRAVFDSWNENTTLEEMRAGWESLFHGTKRVVGATAQKIDADFEGDWIVAPEAEGLEPSSTYMAAAMSSARSTPTATCANASPVRPRLPC